MKKHNLLVAMGFDFKWWINCYIKGDKIITAQKVESVDMADLGSVALNSETFCHLGNISLSCESAIRDKLRTGY